MKAVICRLFGGWAVPGSNRGPLACKAGREPALTGANPPQTSRFARIVARALPGGFRANSGVFGTRQAARVPNLRLVDAWTDTADVPAGGDIRACFPDTNRALQRRLRGL